MDKIVNCGWCGDNCVLCNTYIAHFDAIETEFVSFDAKTIIICETCFQSYQNHQMSRQVSILLPVKNLTNYNNFKNN